MHECNIRIHVHEGIGYMRVKLGYMYMRVILGYMRA